MSNKIKSIGKKPMDGKVRFELVPVDPLISIAKVFTAGAKINGDRDWEKGILWSEIYGAILRHVTDWWNGEEADPGTGENPLAHAGTDIMILLEFIKTHPELDDRPKRKDKEVKK